MSETNVAKHLAFVAKYNAEHHTSPEERAALRSALSDAAHLCDAIAADIIAQRKAATGRKEIPKSAQVVVDAIRTCGNAIWELRQTIGAGGTQEHESER